MKLLRNCDDISNFVIYELDDDEIKLVENKFGHKNRFYVTDGRYSNYYLERHSFADIIQESTCTSPVYYLGFFETYLEAYYHIKLIEATFMINEMEWKIKRAIHTNPYDKEHCKMITENTNKLNVMFYPLTEEKPSPADHPEFKL